METRKQLIEEIMASLNAMKHKMHNTIVKDGKQNRITHSQWFVLCLIESHQNLGIKEISQILGITSSATTQLVDGLVKSGYVNRKTNMQDKRSLHLELSKKGQVHIKEMKIKHIKTMEILFKPLTDKELQTYNMLHQKILTNIKKT